MKQRTFLPHLRPQPPGERRAFPRYHLPLRLTVTDCGPGRARLLDRALVDANISAGGLSFRLAADPSVRLPSEADLEITFPLMERIFHPARVYARCKARLLRRDLPDRVAAHFEEVDFIREEQLTSLPTPLA